MNSSLVLLLLFLQGRREVVLLQIDISIFDLCTLRSDCYVLVMNQNKEDMCLKLVGVGQAISSNTFILLFYQIGLPFASLHKSKDFHLEANPFKTGITQYERCNIPVTCNSFPFFSSQTTHLSYPSLTFFQLRDFF